MEQTFKEIMSSDKKMFDFIKSYHKSKDLPIRDESLLNEEIEALGKKRPIVYVMNIFGEISISEHKYTRVFQGIE